MKEMALGCNSVVGTSYLATYGVLAYSQQLRKRGCVRCRCNSCFFIRRLHQKSQILSIISASTYQLTRISLIESVLKLSIVSLANIQVQRLTIPSQLDTYTRYTAMGLLYLHQKPTAIAKKLYYYQSTIYRLEQRIKIYGTLNLSQRLRIGRPKALYSAAVESLLLYYRRYPYLYYNELVYFIDKEQGIRISQPIVSRVLRRNRISRKKVQIIGDA